MGIRELAREREGVCFKQDRTKRAHLTHTHTHRTHKYRKREKEEGEFSKHGTCASGKRHFLAEHLLHIAPER